jgi:hypothetical protein
MMLYLLSIPFLNIFIMVPIVMALRTITMHHYKKAPAKNIPQLVPGTVQSIIFIF